MGSIDIRDVEREEILQTTQDKLAAHRAHLDLLNLYRRQVLNDYLDLKGNIRVFCRIRPSLPHENSQRQSTIVSDDGKMLLKIENKRKSYNFDKVFHPHSTQEEVFSEVEPVIKSALDGYNVCIFAYGQTGTGKTFTMEGRSDCPGVVPRAMGILFDQAKTVNCGLTFGFSMLEIYIGRLRDLLVPQKAKSLIQTMPCLSIQMDHSGCIEVENLVEIKVCDFEQVKRLYRFGSRLRSTASTMSNATSSRSHCLTRISITSAAPERRRATNKIWMVDLGGSERLLKTQARGRRLEEGKAINLSLSALGDVISSLHNKKSHVPYRNSKLTQVLRDSLGEDSKTLMLVHVSPKEEDFRETICSLGFATRVRSIHLGLDESPDVRACKESVMAELLQKLNHLESESQQVMKDIKELSEDICKVNEKFKQSGEEDILINEHLEASHLNVEDEKFDARTSQHTRDDKGISANLPRFMRPTICSRRKVRMNQCSESTRKKQRVASREAHSVYSEPMGCHTEGTLHPDQVSEGSISRLGHIEYKYVVDIEAEVRQDLSECEMKTVIFTEQKTPGSSRTSENCLTDKVLQTKHLDINEWLLFQPKDLLSTCTQGSKTVFALPKPEQNKRFSEDLFEVMKKEIGTSKCLSVRHSGTARKENNCNYKNVDFFINAKVQKISEDMLKEESSANVVSGTDILLANLLSGKDFECDQNVESTYMVQNLKLVSKSETCLTLTPENSDWGSEDTLIFDQAEGTEVLVSTHETIAELNSKVDDCFESEELIEECQGSYIRSVQTRRSLFMHKHAQTVDQNNVAADEHVAMAPTIFEEANQGICHFFCQIVQILCAITLLGLGSQSLSYNDDFFHGLMF